MNSKEESCSICPFLRAIFIKEYKETETIFKAVNFTRRLRREKRVLVGKALYEASKYYKVSMSDVGSWMNRLPNNIEKQKQILKNHGKYYENLLQQKRD